MVYLLHFFIVVCYNYNGDNMNSSDIIVNIKSIKDIDKIIDNTKYINISIDNVSVDVIDYFLLNGSKFSYSDVILDKNGFIYASYDMFKYGEGIITNIIDSMPNNLNDIEKVRYLYISLGKILCIDINSMDSKNDCISLNNISTVNNVWGALSSMKVNDSIISKIFMYLCYRVGIKCELISTNIKGNIGNKVYIDKNYLIVNLFDDMYNIQGGFITKYFDNYNDNKEIDKKIGYIKDEYMNACIDSLLKNIDYTGENALLEILNLTSSVMNIRSVGTYELYQIYKDIFDKYIPNYDIRINNLFVGNGLLEKNHFTLFSYSGKYYSFNYNKGCFVLVEETIIKDNIKNRKIGIYDDEDFELIEKGVML